VAGIAYTIDEHVATLAVSGRTERNIISAEIATEFAECLVRFDRDPQLRVCIVHGAGNQHFCGGSDEDGTDAALRRFRGGASPRLGSRGMDPDTVRSVKPVIAAVAGDCLDEGLVLLGRVSDIRVAGQSARFGFPGVRSGAAGDLAVRSHLDHQLPFSALRWLIVVGQEIGAEEALRVGLVNEVVADAMVLERAREIALWIAELAPLALRGEKQSILTTEDVPMMDAFLYSAAVGLINRLGPDVVEGVAAFNEKRPPRFGGLA
jgi:E-phenylitaconyl-CoA hydratase